MYITKLKGLFLSSTIIFIMLLMLISTSQAFDLHKAGENWFETYDINDTEKNWQMITRPITILNVAEKKEVYLLDSPSGKKVKRDKLGGYIWGNQAGVKVLGADEDGYTLIEGYDDHDRLLQGYVKTSLLQEVTPNQDIGIIIDKLTQELYVFKNGKYLTKLSISTGLINKDQPYNETSSGEYLITSWVGDFWSGNMLCKKGIRYNGGDLIHYVPALVKKDGTHDFKYFAEKLGTKASHGCVRVQESKNEDGYNMLWLWDNLKKGSKVIVWDDTGRELPYPDDYTLLYYNTVGGNNFHSVANCSSVRSKYLPLTPFYYGQMRDTDPYNKLNACPVCNPPTKEKDIDQRNCELLNEEQYSELMKRRDEIHSHFDPFNLPERIKNKEYDPDTVLPIGMKQPYPDDYSLVYYNPKGGKNYHKDNKCSNVKQSLWPLTAIYYGQLRNDDFNKLTPCPYCNPFLLESDIDKINKRNLSSDDYNELMKEREALHNSFDPNITSTQKTENSNEATNEAISVENDIVLGDDDQLILPDAPQESVLHSQSDLDNNDTSIDESP